MVDGGGNAANASALALAVWANRTAAAPWSAPAPAAELVAAGLFAPAGGRVELGNVTLAAAGEYVLTFAAAGLGPAVSGPFTVGVGGPAALVVVTQPPPAGAAAGERLAPPPAVALVDAGGNRVAAAGLPAAAALDASRFVAAQRPPDSTDGYCRVGRRAPRLLLLALWVGWRRGGGGGDALGRGGAGAKVCRRAVGSCARVRGRAAGPARNRTHGGLSI